VGTGLTLATLEDYQGWEALNLSFSADGRKLLTSGSNGEANIWDLRSFDRHIAWNTEYQISRLADELGPELRADQARAWAVSASRPPPAAAIDPLAVGLEAIRSWSRSSP